MVYLLTSKALLYVRLFSKMEAESLGEIIHLIVIIAAVMNGKILSLLINILTRSYEVTGSVCKFQYLHYHSNTFISGHLNAS